MSELCKKDNNRKIHLERLLMKILRLFIDTDQYIMSSCYLLKYKVDQNPLLPSVNGLLWYNVTAKRMLERLGIQTSSSFDKICLYSGIQSQFQNFFGIFYLETIGVT